MKMCVLDEIVLDFNAHSLSLLSHHWFHEKKNSNLIWLFKS